MYKIINRTKGEIIGFVEKPRYIYLSENGSYVQCDEIQAQGIAYQSQPYNLVDRKPLDTNIETVILQEFDLGECIWNLQTELNNMQISLQAIEKEN